MFPLDDRTRNAFTREASFSLIHFRGNVLEALPQLLDGCGYRPVENATLAGPFEEVYWSLQDAEDPETPTMRKAAYLVPGGTVLMDPEMVIGFSHADVLQQFCVDTGSVAVVALWERVSESALVLTVTSAGVRSRTFLIRGQPEGEQVAPNANLAASPDATGVRQVMASLAIPVDSVFGNVEAWGIELHHGNPGV